MVFEFIAGIQEFVLSLGAFGIFFGMFLESSVVPIPSEAVLVAAGALGFSPVEIAIFGGLGSSFGAVVGYYIGRYGGRPFLVRYGKYFMFNESKMKFVDNWFDRWGSYSVLVSRLIPLIPFKIFSIAAGIGKMNLLHFFVFTLIGSIPRSFILGYFGSLLTTAGNTLLMIAILAIFIALPVGISKYISIRRGNRTGKKRK